MNEDIEIDFYEVLDVNDDASIDAIKAAYRRLALQYHPDKTSDPLLHKRFHHIQKAWEVLSDPILRKNFDRELLRKESEGLHAEKMVLGLWLRNGPTNLSDCRRSDFDYDSSSSLWIMRCRCGEKYDIADEDAVVNELILMQCLGCSLYVSVEIKN